VSYLQWLNKQGYLLGFGHQHKTIVYQTLEQSMLGPVGHRMTLP
jgi:hypothetical protein